MTSQPFLSPRCCAPAGAAPTSEGTEELPGSWDGVCDWVLGRWVSVWDQIFEAAFLQRSKDLIAASFAQVGRQSQPSHGTPLVTYPCQEVSAVTHGRQGSSPCIACTTSQRTRTAAAQSPATRGAQGWQKRVSIQRCASCASPTAPQGFRIPNAPTRNALFVPQVSASLDAPLKAALAAAAASPAAPPGAFQGRGSWLDSLAEGASPGGHEGEGSALKRARLLGSGSSGGGRVSARQPAELSPGVCCALELASLWASHLAPFPSLDSRQCSS